MRIARVSWLRFRIALADSFATAHGTAVYREGLVLRLTTDDGLVGLGEASPVAAFGGGTVADAECLVADLAPGLIGCDLTAVDERLGLEAPPNRRISSLDQPGGAAVACAFDTAICELRAKQMGIPVAALLGSRIAQRVPVNAVVGAVTTDGAVAAAQRAVAAGYRTIKLKVGLATSRQAEIDRIAAVRAAIGFHGQLRLDANGSWDVETAIAILRAIERYAIELVEQPVPADDLDGMARVRASVTVPIAADESVGDPEQARRVVDAGAADVLVVKPMLAGGLRAGRRIVDLAAGAGLAAFVTTSIDSGVGIAAALHLAATLPGEQAVRERSMVLACGLATGPLLAGDVVQRPLPIHAGMMALPDAPGLGVALDHARVARYGGGWREVGL